MVRRGGLVVLGCVCLGLTLGGCPAEDLGIELPPGGAASISVDDLQRDIAGLLAKGEGWYARRMSQMHFEVVRGEGWMCGQRGEGPGRTFVADLPTDVDHASTAAVLIAMAKGWDTVGTLPGERRYCLGGGEGAPRVRLGPFAPGVLGEGLPEDGGVLGSGTLDPTRRPEAVDYRELAEKARILFQRDGGPAFTGPPPTPGRPPRSP